MKHPEHLLQSAIIIGARWLEPRFPELSLLFATNLPNKLNARQASRAKFAGIKAGVPDLCLPVGIVHNRPRKDAPTLGLWLELKATGKSPSSSQRQWIAALRDQGHEVHVCRDAEKALSLLTDYLTRVYRARGS